MRRKLLTQAQERVSVLREYEYDIERLVRANEGLGAAESYIKHNCPMHKKSLAQMQHDVRAELAHTRSEYNETLLRFLGEEATD